MRNRQSYISTVLGIFALAAVTARADDFWTKKEWQKWSDGDCNKMLKDSPWSRTYTMSKANVSASLRSDTNPSNTSSNTDPLSSSGAGTSSAVAGETKEEINYIVQLRSALPVRQAMVREMEIKQKYDKFSADQKKQFDDKAGKFLTRSYDDAIIVDVQYDSNIQAFARSLAEYWQSVPEERAPEDTHLILPDGKRISPVRFASQKGANYEFEFIFPRVQNGEPVIGTNDKIVGLEFNHPNLRGVPDFPAQRIYVEFKTDKMALNGKMVY